ncbi:glycoside hydrolase family 5 protein [Tulasnella calospora MUT 4182]|uniref:glucan 1,3-beta-glucosidase n=1 Tax=Tulasnella calospora MUT 4182 TaxID=1051891 RepID=A0A0C3QMP6_9AGAM|nr:glycoside hydrolase family 5 protein [Tulasnella calospora MUT 4182]
MSQLPPGASQPRFLAPRFQGQGANEPGFRDSYASSQVSLNAPSYQTADYESVHGLNFNQQHRPTTSLTSAAAAGGLGSPLLPTERYHDDPYSHPNESAGAIPLSPVGTGQGYREYPEKRDQYTSPRQQSKRRGWLILGIIILVLLIIAAVGIPVYIFIIKPRLNSTSEGAKTDNGSHTGTSNTGTNGSNDSNDDVVVTGSDGSTVTFGNGTTFTYKNPFGGYWYYDPKDPFNNGAKAQSYTPALNETWDWNNDRVYGVNLGGWLNTEPFISPALYEKYYPDAVDEFTLSQQMAADTAGGGLKQLEDHYATFITEEDFAAIAAAGLNWVRIPIAFWAIETWDGEPFLEGVSWKYFLKGVQWARKYGIRINLDFHAVPGSQNGWNHSGRLGDPNFLHGVMGLANADRTLDYIRTFIQFISQPEYKDVIPMFGVVNEPFTPTIGAYPMNSFYIQVHDLVRDITGRGAGNGPMLSLHEGFQGTAYWAGAFPGADRFALDLHPYFAFGGQTNDALETQALRACTTWVPNTNGTFSKFGFTAAGEFSNAINDCGQYVNGVGLGTRYEGTFDGVTAVTGDCKTWTDYESWTQDTKDGVKLFAMASMDALVHWFFWTWKIGPTLATGKVAAPFWSYSLGLQEGWMPTDPRSAAGVCASLGVASTPAGPLPATATGGPGAGTISAAFRASYSAWPVTSLADVANAAVLPTYTATGTLKTLPGLTITTPGSTATFDAGSGWFNPGATPLGAHQPIPGCNYPNEYSAQVDQVPIPTAACAAAKRKRSEEPAAPQITAFRP